VRQVLTATYIYTLAASADNEALPQNHVYVRFMFVFVNSATEEKHNSNIMFVERYSLTVPLKIALLITLVINFPENTIYNSGERR
jgi:hypothetical protein